MSNAPARLAAVTPNAPPTVTISPHIETLGPPSGFTCPDCGATRITLDEDYYRRRVGHAWTAAGLLHACDRQFENAVCVAVRSLKEARSVPTGAENSTRGDDGERYQAAAGEAQQKLDILTSALSGGGNCPGT